MADLPHCRGHGIPQNERGRQKALKWVMSSSSKEIGNLFVKFWNPTYAHQQKKISTVGSGRVHTVSLPYAIPFETAHLPDSPQTRRRGGQRQPALCCEVDRRARTDGRSGEDPPPPPILGLAREGTRGLGRGRGGPPRLGPVSDLAGLWLLSPFGAIGDCRLGSLDATIWPHGSRFRLPLLTQAVGSMDALHSRAIISKLALSKKFLCAKHTCFSGDSSIKLKTFPVFPTTPMPRMDL